jgi:hypothetical protein
MQGRRAAPLEYTGRVGRMRYEERSVLERCIHQAGSGGGQKHLGAPVLRQKPFPAFTRTRRRILKGLHFVALVR